MKLNKVLVSLETNGIEIFEFWNADKIKNFKKNFDNNAVDINILPIVELYSIDINILPIVELHSIDINILPIVELYSIRLG